MSYLVLDEQRALWGMREVCSGPLHHQFEDCICWNVVQIMLPQNDACLAVNPKELHRKQIRMNTRKQFERTSAGAFGYCVLSISA